MTKILIDRATAEQAFEALKEFGYHGSSPRWERTANALKAALEQQPVQEPTPWRDMVVVSLVREGLNKHKARELADHFAAQPVQEPVGEVVEVSDNGFKCEFSQRLAIGTKLYIAPPLPVQEPVACRFCHSKKGSWTWQCYSCGEIDDVQKPAPPQQQAETVAMRMPKVGDKVICIEDESLGEVVSLTAGGSPDILFDDGSRGTYLLHEFAELFGYVTSLLPVQEPPQYSLKAHWTDDKRIGVVACVTRPDGGVHLLQTIIDSPSEQEDAFEGWVKIDEVRKHFDSVGCGTIYQHGGEGRVLLRAAPPKREWVGLMEQDMPSGEDPMFDHKYFIAGMVYADKVLKEKNT